MRTAHHKLRLMISLILSLTISTADATTVSFAEPDLDRWHYPFNASPGTRANGSTFGALFPGNGGMFDERDAQIVLGFDTDIGGIPTGQGASNYQINSVKLTITTQAPDPSQQGGGFDYDPTYDDFSSYLLPPDSRFTPDFDDGRPIELYGLGLRNGFSSLDFDNPSDGGPGFGEEDEFAPFQPPFPPAETRNAFAIDVSTGAPRDVSNNFDFDTTDGIADTGGFNPTPFAIGQTLDVNPGETVFKDVTFTFDVNLTDANILGYFQQALNDGELGLVLSSLHGADQTGPTTFPDIYLDPNVFGGTFSPPTLEIDFTIGPASSDIPEPATAFTLLLAGGSLMLRRRQRGSIT